jgi:hypothetical protein
MPVDPQIQAFLDKGAGVPATHTLPVAEARRQYNGRTAITPPGPERADGREPAMAGPGGPLKLRL